MLGGRAHHRQVLVAASNLMPWALQQPSHTRSIRGGEGAERSSPRGDVGSLLKPVEGEMGAS
jgi:hypothetical protein